MTLALVRSVVSYLSGIRAVHSFLIRLPVLSLRTSRRCDRSVYYGFRIFSRWVVHRCPVWASPFDRYASCSLGLRSDSGGSLLRPMSLSGHRFMQSFRRELVRSPGPLVVVSSVRGTTQPSNSYGLGRANIGERSTFVVLALAWEKRT